MTTGGFPVRRLCVALYVVTLIGWSGRAAAERNLQLHPAVRGTERDRECLVCHAGVGQEDAPKLNLDGFRSSVHAQVGCVSCHSSVEDRQIRHDLPQEDLRPVDCGQCHGDEQKKYLASSHAKHPQGPKCWSCHSKHEVLAADHPRATTHAARQLEACGECHDKERTAAGHTLEVPPEYLGLLDAAGAKPLESLKTEGLLVSASCVDCHGPHQVAPPQDPGSSLHLVRGVETCGTCHRGELTDYRASVHASALSDRSAGKPLASPHHEAPSCITCHAMHAKRSASAPSTDAFRLNIVSECGTCHADLYRSYQESYHGKATNLGNATIAKCSDCHGNHEIRRPEDAKSSVSTERKLETCRECHESAPANFATFWPHADHHDSDKYPMLFWVWAFMTTLMVSTFSLFGLHTLLWGIREALDAVRERHRPKHAHSPRRIERFALFHRITHLLVIISFLGLTATGAPLKFSKTGWAKAFMNVFGGVEVAAWLHRFFAVMTFVYFSMHVTFIARRLLQLKREGKLRQSLLGPDSLVPQLADLRDIFAQLRWFVGRGPKPTFERWTYWEKFDYWAVFWGVAIIGGSGLVLWFPTFFTHVLPGWAVNVALVIHSDEALMAIGFIFGVHFFNSHLRRTKFPMDAVIFTGTLPEDEFQAERGKQWERLQAEGVIDALRRAPPNPRVMVWIRVFGISAWLFGLTLLGLILHGVFSQ